MGTPPASSAYIGHPGSRCITWCATRPGTACASRYACRRYRSDSVGCMAHAARGGRWGELVVEGPVARIDAATAPLRAAIAGHRLAELLDDREAVRIFMEHHVVAVWDFMSLLKALQRDVTCVSVPWTPRGDAAHRRFVNELVLAEESDVAPGGGYTSHLELYLDAMVEVEANTAPIRRVLADADRNVPLDSDCGMPPAAASFARATLDLARTAPVHQLAATFAFGRERLIPSMFVALRAAALRCEPRLTLLLAYLDRHIDVDAGEHTPLAFSLLQGLCGDDVQRWAEAEDAALESCRRRLALWDAAAVAIEERAENTSWATRVVEKPAVRT